MRLIYLSVIICIFASYNACAAEDLLHYKIYTSNQNTTIHVLTLDPKKVKIVAKRAQDIGHGLDTVGNIASHFGALAAINGGYFRVDNLLSYNGVPAGVLKINNYWHGIAYKSRGALGWDPETGTSLIDIVQTDSQVLLQDHSLPINAMNKLVTGNRAALLSSSYGDALDITNNTAIVIADQKVQAVYNSGKISIPNDGYIYTWSGDEPEYVQNIKPGDRAQVKINVQPQVEKITAKQWNQMPFIVGGGPVLINKKQKSNNFASEQLKPDFINDQNARTAVGILPDKRWVFVVAERSILEGKEGLTIPELRDFMYSLGCVSALNLDGGGSTAMYIANVKYGNITDQPVADVLLVLPK